MKRLKQLTISFCLTSTLLLSGCALPLLLGSSKGEPVNNALPRLAMAVDCGDCELAALTLQWMNEGFQAAAKADNKKDIPAVTLITVKAYSERSMLWKIAGPLALARSDEIKGNLVVRGQLIEVADSRRLPMQGMDTVARAVGKQAYEALTK
jgi:hypothetical protein